METKDEKAWYALYTKSRAEKKVLQQFTQMGLTAYLPLKKELRQWSDRKKWVESPIISSYIFVCVSPQNQKSVYDVNGVVAYVTDKGKPAIIPASEIEAMQKTINNQVAFDIETDRLKKGLTVEVTSGPLKGVKGEIVEIKGEKKLTLKISHIGYTLVVDLANATFQ